ncbi:7355_t:CDS:2, partial [Gigaspora margarita]
SNNSKSSKDSWVWEYIQKDILNKQVACNIIIVSLDGHEKKYDKVYSISTSTTHLDNLAQTIPSMLSKIDSHKPAKQQQLVFRLIAWIVEDCQPLIVVDGQEFRQFCYKMNPRFQVPRPALIKTKIQESV